jgi:C-terminal processing protease CtpA/Prc
MKCGVGLTIGKTAQNSVLITSIQAGGPAQGTVENGDQLLRVNGKEVSLMALETIISQLTGEEGSVVTLELLRDEEKEPSLHSQSLSTTASNGRRHVANSNPFENHQNAAKLALECSPGGGRPAVTSFEDLSAEDEVVRLVLHRKIRQDPGPAQPGRSPNSAGRVGVGASFVLSPAGEALITAVDGSPPLAGSAAGLRPGDRIIAVDGTSVQVIRPPSRPSLEPACAGRSVQLNFVNTERNKIRLQLRIRTQ